MKTLRRISILQLIGVLFSWFAARDGHVENLKEEAKGEAQYKRIQTKFNSQTDPLQSCINAVKSVPPGFSDPDGLAVTNETDSERKFYFVRSDGKLYVYGSVARNYVFHLPALADDVSSVNLDLKDNGVALKYSEADGKSSGEVIPRGADASGLKPDVDDWSEKRYNDLRNVFFQALARNIKHVVEEHSHRVQVAKLGAGPKPDSSVPLKVMEACKPISELREWVRQAEESLRENDPDIRAKYDTEATIKQNSEVAPGVPAKPKKYFVPSARFR